MRRVFRFRNYQSSCKTGSKCDVLNLENKLQIRDKNCFINTCFWCLKYFLSIERPSSYLELHYRISENTLKHPSDDALLPQLLVQCLVRVGAVLRAESGRTLAQEVTQSSGSAWLDAPFGFVGLFFDCHSTCSLDHRFLGSLGVKDAPVS